MDKNSTLLISSKEVLKTNEQQGPKVSTLNFLKQFARVYGYENSLPSKLGNFVAN